MKKDNVYDLISALSIKKKLETNRDLEVINYKKHYESIIRSQPDCRDIVADVCKKSVRQIGEAYNPLIDVYQAKLCSCHHQLVFSCEEDDLCICACCDQVVDGSKAIKINVPSCNMNPEFIEQLRKAILNYIFFNPEYTLDEITIFLDNVIKDENKLKLCLEKKEG